MARALFALILALAACTDFPQLAAVESAAAARADYPRLVPLTDLLASTDTVPLTDPTLSRDLAGRVARLRARAAMLRQSALTPADRQRLREAVARLSAAV